MVRIMKNMRSRLVDDGKIGRDTAPSYYIEGMIWNVPDENFGSSYEGTFCKCMNWIVKTDRTKLKCAHGQHALLGTSNVQWPAAKCDEFLLAIISLWEG
jgi:hypothetical protein